MHLRLHHSFIHMPIDWEVVGWWCGVCCWGVGACVMECCSRASPFSPHPLCVCMCLYVCVNVWWLCGSGGGFSLFLLCTLSLSSSSSLSLPPSLPLAAPLSLSLVPPLSLSTYLPVCVCLCMLVRRVDEYRYDAYHASFAPPRSCIQV